MTSSSAWQILELLDFMYVHDEGGYVQGVRDG